MRAMSVVISGSNRLYRNLFVKIGDGEMEWAEDLDWSDDIPAGMTPAQAQIVGAFQSGDFELTVNADGTFSIKIEEGLSPSSMRR